jgi:hypothetical protein
VADLVLRGKRYSNTSLDSKRVPDFVKLAEAMGCVGLSCERPEDVDAIIKQANAINDQPVVVDFRVFRDAMVWPMVAAGTSNDDIMIARELWRPTGIHRSSNEYTYAVRSRRKLSGCTCTCCRFVLDVVHTTSTH